MAAVARWTTHFVVGRSRFSAPQGGVRSVPESSASPSLRDGRHCKCELFVLQWRPCYLLTRLPALPVLGTPACGPALHRHGDPRLHARRLPVPCADRRAGIRPLAGRLRTRATPPDPSLSMCEPSQPNQLRPERARLAPPSPVGARRPRALPGDRRVPADRDAAPRGRQGARRAMRWPTTTNCTAARSPSASAARRSPRRCSASSTGAMRSRCARRRKRRPPTRWPTGGPKRCGQRRRRRAVGHADPCALHAGAREPRARRRSHAAAPGRHGARASTLHRFEALDRRERRAGARAGRQRSSARTRAGRRTRPPQRAAAGEIVQLRAPS